MTKISYEFCFIFPLSYAFMELDVFARPLFINPATYSVSPYMVAPEVINHQSSIDKLDVCACVCVKRPLFAIPVTIVHSSCY